MNPAAVTAMGLRQLAIVASLLALVACEGLAYVSEEYSGISAVAVAMPDDRYNVYDKPAAGRMMISSSFGGELMQAIGGGLLLGEDLTPPRPRFEAAAEKFLKDTGRADCRVNDGYRLVKARFEFRYICPEKK